MRKSLIALCLIILLVALCFYIRWFNIVLLALVLLITLYIILATAVRKLMGKKINPLLGSPLRLIGICLIAIAASFFIPWSPAIIETGDISAELKYAYETDQGDRKNLKSYTGIFQSEIQSRDELRLDQVKKYYSEGNIKKPLDKFHAAFVYHHSDNSADYEVATKLAAEAAGTKELKDHYLTQWLAKASYDRWMLSIGKPEKYGTQNSFSVNVEN